MKKRFPILAFILLTFCAATPTRVHAAFTFLVAEVGPDVVVTGSGSFNTTGLTLRAPSGIYVTNSFINPSVGVLGLSTPNSNGLPGDLWTGFNGPASFGFVAGSSSGATVATTSTGSLVQIQGTGPGVNPYFVPVIALPVGYVSGSPLANGAVFANASFASLGFTPGTYTWTWGSGASADSLTVTSVVPEPSAWACAGLSVLVVMAARRKWICS